MHRYTDTHTHTRTHTGAHIHRHTQTHWYVSSHTHTHTHTHTTQTCTQRWINHTKTLLKQYFAIQLYGLFISKAEQQVCNSVADRTPKNHTASITTLNSVISPARVLITSVTTVKSYIRVQTLTSIIALSLEQSAQSSATLGYMWSLSTWTRSQLCRD